MRVFVTHSPEDLEAYYGRALPELRALADVVVNPHPRDLTTDELVAAAAGCQVVVAHRSAAGPAELFERSPDLLAFLRCAVDISTVDVAAASREGVLVAHADHSYVTATSELALGLLLDLFRHITISSVEYRRGEDPPQRPGREIAGSTVGILGHGRIGRRFASDVTPRFSGDCSRRSTV